MAPKKIEFCSTTTSEEIKEIIKNLVLTIIAFENSGTDESLEKAEQGWVGFGHLISEISSKVEKNIFISSALEFTKEDDPYLVNAGLSMLGLPEVIESYTAKNQQEELIALFSEYIPSEEDMQSINPRSSDMYNFLMSVEGLLNLDQDELLGNKLTKTHEEILRECCDAPDMAGTKINEKYGE